MTLSRICEKSISTAFFGVASGDAHLNWSQNNITASCSLLEQINWICNVFIYGCCCLSAFLVYLWFNLCRTVHIFTVVCFILSYLSCKGLGVGKLKRKNICLAMLYILILLPFFLLGALPLLSVRVSLALFSSALLSPSLWLAPPLSA